MNFDFALILLVLLLLTLVVKVLDKLIFKPKRVALYGDEHQDHQPWWIEWSISFFPVILFVFALRSFVVEPFRIPSGSMLPTLQSGDMILVNKYTYGIRLPVVNKKIIDLNEPKRGDVIVFRYPVDTSIDYIKRVVAIPGDKIVYENLNKRLIINDKVVQDTEVGDYIKPEQQSGSPVRYTEKLDGVKHDILKLPYAIAAFPEVKFPFSDHCEYTKEQVTCEVPKGHYFALGDNRDSSKDSRFWGFVPNENIVGKAFYIWMNFGEFSRIGSFN